MQQRRAAAASQLLLLLGVCCSLLLSAASGQGLPTQFGLLPLGDLTTSDQGGPYAIPDVQAFEVEAALAAKTGAPGGPFTDADVLNFLANTECLEATFNSYAAFGAGLPASLKPGAVAGGRRAALSPEVQSWAEEVALDEAGHVRMVRQVVGDERSVPCPALDLTGGFRAFFDAALNNTSTPPFDPFKSDVHFLLATWSLEEIGATGDKGCILLASNPGVANCIAGLACAASYQSGIDRHFLWQRRNETVEEYNKTVHQIVEAISNIKDTWDGPGDADQPLYNGNPAFIAVPSGNINLVPTDLRGLTYSRTPQQVLRIVTLGSESGKGGFFPQGLNGRINSPAGYNVSANAFGGYPGNQVTVLSLAEANRTALLNNNITVIVPPPLALQAEASGQQYLVDNRTAANTTEAPPPVTLIGAASPSSPAPSNTSQETSGALNTSSNATSTGNGSSVLEAGPGNDTTTAGAAGNTTMADNATTTNTTSSGSGSNATNTTSAVVVVVPISTALNATSTNQSALASPAPAFTSTPGAADNATTTASPSPAPVTGGVGGDNTTTSSASPAPVTGGAGGDNATTSSPSPAPTTTTTTASSPAGGDNETTASVVVVPVSTALNATSTNQSQLTSPAPAVTSTPGASSSSTSASPEPGAGGNATTANSSLIAPISSPAVAVVNASSLAPASGSGAGSADSGSGGGSGTSTGTRKLMRRP